ncbi:MAG: hypothetical protein FWE30_07220 [Bacteroidales bacterium]|nr:hypothetical protein [Bacteroidales bacterium]MCL2739221.1 hypothetical protein [Bacteroidales bacterium]
MKNLNLNECGVCEISQKEMAETNGGVGLLELILIGIVVGAVIEVINDWDNFKAGLTGQPEIMK